MVMLKVLFKRAQGSDGGGGNVVVKYEDGEVRGWCGYDE